MKKKILKTIIFWLMILHFCPFVIQLYYWLFTKNTLFDSDRVFASLIFGVVYLTVWIGNTWEE